MKTHSASFITVRAFVASLLMLCHVHCLQAQKSPVWEVSAAATRFNFTGIGQRYGFGATAEFFITSKISTRGSLLVNKDYVRLSLAPFFWDYAVDFINKKPDPRGESYSSSKGKLYSKPVAFFLGLLLSDGITYHVSLAKDLYFCPYVAPLQIQVCLPQSAANPKGGIISTSLGLGLKAYRKSLVFYAGAEYSKSFIMQQAGFGYSINASVGYVVLRKKK